MQSSSVAPTHLVTVRISDLSGSSTHLELIGMLVAQLRYRSLGFKVKSTSYNIQFVMKFESDDKRILNQYHRFSLNSLEVASLSKDVERFGASVDARFSAWRMGFFISDTRCGVKSSSSSLKVTSSRIRRKRAAHQTRSSRS